MQGIFKIVMSSGKKTCPRPGRSPWRRKKNYLLIGFAGIILYGFIQMTQLNDGYTALRPLSDAQSEAKRLLKFITHYNYQCNNTIQIGNRSHWPICIEKEAGLDLDTKDTKILYTVGSNMDLMVERHLAYNHTFQVFIVSPEELPIWAKQLNSTYSVKASLVPNDPADFSRNSYGQKTLNTLLKELHHDRIDILRLVNLERGVNMWELIHFMNYDNILLNVQQLHLAMYIEKLDEDYLYNWYRALYELFYKEGFRLYHTSSRDSLCLQVTMMESCIYYLSFIKNPGPNVFVLHPPADYGTLELEEERLLHYLSIPQIECKQEVLGAPDEQALHFTPNNHFQWQVCANGLYELFKKPCSVFRFRLANDHVLEQKFIKEGCSVHTVEPMSRSTVTMKAYKLHSHQPEGRHHKSHRMSQDVSFEEILHLLREQKEISLIEIDLPGYEWEVLGQLLDSGILENATQIVANLQISDGSLGNHPTVFRSRYSELRRLEMQGFNIFHTEQLRDSPLGPRALGHQFHPHCCFRVGFLKKDNFYR